MARVRAATVKALLSSESVFVALLDAVLVKST